MIPFVPLLELHSEAACKFSSCWSNWCGCWAQLHKSLESVQPGRPSPANRIMGSKCVRSLRHQRIVHRRDHPINIYHQRKARMRCDILQMCSIRSNTGIRLLQQSRCMLRGDSHQCLRERGFGLVFLFCIVVFFGPGQFRWVQSDDIRQL